MNYPKVKVHHLLLVAPFRDRHSRSSVYSHTNSLHVLLHYIAESNPCLQIVLLQGSSIFTHPTHLSHVSLTALAELSLRWTCF